MNNRLSPSPETLSSETRTPQTVHTPDSALHDDFRQAFMFFDGVEHAELFSQIELFTQSMQQQQPCEISMTGPIPFMPVIAGDDNVMASSSTTPVLWQPLQDELLEALDNIGPSPFSFSLQLPQLGDIDARLTAMTPCGWDIALRFSRESYQRLKDRRASCRRALSDALGCPVTLSFDLREFNR